MEKSGPSDPELLAEWLESRLARIHERWPRDTAEQHQAATRFAQEHGLE